MNNIIAVDFDGTLCRGDNYPDIGEPNMPMIDYILEQQAKGAKIILYTCREGKELSEAVEWCKQWNLYFDAVNENIPEIIDQFGYSTRKIVATEYIDDRAKNPEDATIFYMNAKKTILGWTRGTVTLYSDSMIVDYRDEVYVRLAHDQDAFRDRLFKILKDSEIVDIVAKELWP